MPALALTDHANMMGAFHFYFCCFQKHNKKVKALNEEALQNGEQPVEIEIKPIVGCEFFICEDHLNKKH